MDTSKELELLRESWAETFDQLFVLFELAREVAIVPEIDTLLDHVAGNVSLLFDVDLGTICLLDASTQRLNCHIIKGEKAGQIDRNALNLRIGEGLAGSVAESGKAAIVPEAGNDSRLAKEQALLPQVPLRDALCVPIMTQGKILGVMSACNKRKGTFTIKDRDFLVAVANLVALILTSHTK